jgi:ABC-2 type transport system permease protein
MTQISFTDRIKRSWAITVKDIRIYYLRPPALMFGILFPVALFFTFTVGRDMSPEKLVPVLAAQTVFWSASSIGPVAIPMERRLRTFERFLSAPISLLAVLWGKMMAGFIFGAGITTLATGIGIIWSNQATYHPAILVLGIGLSSLVYSAMGILFASIPTASPGEVIIPLNFVRIPLMFVSGMFIPIENMPISGQLLAALSPLTHTIDLFKLGTGSTSIYGFTTNISALLIWMAVFLYVGQTFHRMIMKRE